VDREGEAEDRDGLGLLDGAAGDASACRAAADDQREVFEQLCDNRDPGLVELACRRLASAAGDAVGLLDQPNAEARAVGRPGRSLEVGRLDPAPGSMPEHDRTARRVDRM
jgi:hypothetical protein